jgi:hypothetical protein
MGKTTKMAIVAWLLVLLYYFYQYALRSAPAVMIPQLSEVFGINALGVASIIGVGLAIFLAFFLKETGQTLIKKQILT